METTFLSKTRQKQSFGSWTTIGASALTTRQLCTKESGVSIEPRSLVTPTIARPLDSRGKLSQCIRQTTASAAMCDGPICAATTVKNFDHRKQWIQDRLESLAGQFGIDVLGFAASRSRHSFSFPLRREYSPGSPTLHPKTKTSPTRDIRCVGPFSSSERELPDQRLSYPDYFSAGFLRNSVGFALSPANGGRSKNGL